MAGATLTTVDKILKDLYLGPIRDQITDGVVLYQQFQKNHEDVSGRQAVIPVHYGRNAGMGIAAESGALPTAGAQKYKQLTYSLKYMYGRLQITGQTLKSTKNDSGAFARALEREIDGLTRDFKNELNRILNGDGTGVYTTVSSSTGPLTTVQVVSTRFLYEDMTIDINGDQVTIVSVDSDTQITVDAAITVVAAESVKRRIGATVISSEPNGLANLVDSTGTVGGIDAATNLWWASYEDSPALARDLTLDLMQAITRKVEERSNESPDFFFCKHAIRDRYLALLVADKRFVNTKALDGGYTAVTYNEIPILVDKDATDNTLYAVKKSHFSIFESTPMDWMDEDGAVLSRVANMDAYEATLFYYFQVGIDNRRYQAKLGNLNES